MSELITLGITGGSSSLALGISGDGGEFSLGITRDASGGRPYTGTYNVTPSSEEQVLETTGCKLINDVTIAPIPDNYGLITYNGSSIMVS